MHFFRQAASLGSLRGESTTRRPLLPQHHPPPPSEIPALPWEIPAPDPPLHTHTHQAVLPAPTCTSPNERKQTHTKKGPNQIPPPCTENTSDPNSDCRTEFPLCRHSAGVTAVYVCVCLCVCMKGKIPPQPPMPNSARMPTVDAKWL